MSLLHKAMSRQTFRYSQLKAFLIGIFIYTFFYFEIISTSQESCQMTNLDIASPRFTGCSRPRGSLSPARTRCDTI